MTDRKHERVQCHVLSSAHIPTLHAGITILDVSETGCRIETDSPSAQVGATIILALPRDQFASGQVVWKSRNECGVHFHRAIIADLIDSIAVQGAVLSV